MPDPAGPSTTARRVAAYRLGFDRLAPPSSSGEPVADDRLAADVSDGVDLAPESRMGRYLQARTRFFDRVTVNALGRGVSQIVVIGAGYDARALRYRQPGVRWWEVDRPGTQEDKRARLSRLGIATEDITFVGIDLIDRSLASSLMSAGFEPDGPALFLAEGVVTYLDSDTLLDVLRDLRSLSAPGTRLAFSVRRPGTDEAARARFDAGVAGLGEPALGSTDADDADAVLTRTRWRRVELNDRAHASGFVVAAPLFVPADQGEPVTVGRLGTFVEHMLSRRGSDTLAVHLEDTYGVRVTATKELDLGVFRVTREDTSTWIARVFPRTRTVEAARADAALLGELLHREIPAERPATADPVSVHDGQPVLVTEFVSGRHPAATPELFEVLGTLLARIHTVDTDAPPLNRPGGAWHHLVLDASVADELIAAKELLHDARLRVPKGHAGEYDQLVDALEALALPDDLPTGLVHPDFVPRNAIQDDEGQLTIVDWAGCGVGPRLASLGCLLWAAARHGPSLTAAARSYGARIALERDELEHLPAALAIRPVILACWAFATGRSSLPDAAGSWTTLRPKLAKAATRASTILARDS